MPSLPTTLFFVHGTVEHVKNAVKKIANKAYIDIYARDKNM